MPALQKTIYTFGMFPHKKPQIYLSGYTTNGLEQSCYILFDNHLQLKFLRVPASLSRRISLNKTYSNRHYITDYYCPQRRVL
ncbi:hypothetical protein NIES4101_38170 [Calothrix sp. NIES-4101]|nr:hypothetical protein NIES4101_38170 [Calothrix sp. NIES-4101]